MKRWQKIGLVAAAVIVPVLSCGQRSLVLLDVRASTAFQDPAALLNVQLSVTANNDVTTRYARIHLQPTPAYQIGMYLPSDMTGTVTFHATVDNGPCIIGTGTAVAMSVKAGETSQPIDLIIEPTNECTPIGDGGPGGSGSAGTTGTAGTMGAAGTGPGGAGGMTGVGGVTGSAGAAGVGGMTGSAGRGGATGAAGAAGTAGAGPGSAGRGGVSGAGGVAGAAGVAGAGGRGGAAGTGTPGTAGIGGATSRGGAGGGAGIGGTFSTGGSGGAGGTFSTGGSGGAGGVTGVGGSGPGGSGPGGATGCGSSTCSPPYVCNAGGMCVCSETGAQACLRAGIGCGFVTDNCGQQLFCTCPIAGTICDTQTNKCMAGCTTGTGGIITAAIICPTGTD